MEEGSRGGVRRDGTYRVVSHTPAVLVVMETYTTPYTTILCVVTIIVPEDNVMFGGCGFW